ncbi:hypothetical protein LCGC14_0342080 [marine sediment metagenome]|uniref:Uncharacterized protein n=1 Tax=marine sediment metagenome TaxID=412755 RepID=A0A0F9W0J9_9ZZZZ
MKVIDINKCTDNAQRLCYRRHFQYATAKTHEKFGDLTPVFQSYFRIPEVVKRKLRELK